MSAIKKFKENKLVKENVFVDKPVEYINTGSVALNILFSGKVDGGIVKGKVMQIVAPSSLGKSFVAMKIAKSAQKQGMEVVIVDTEFAYTTEFSKKIGLDDSKTLVIQSNSIEEAQHMIMSSVDGMTREEKDNLLIIIDSWGNMVTSKSVDDVIAGKDVRDMTKAQKKNEFARQLTGLRTTVFVVNQTYACGTENMEVKTIDGNKSLRDIEVGEMVLTTNGFEPVQSTVKYKDTIVNEIELENGDVLEFTLDHKFQVERNGEIVWVPLSELEVGEELITM